jgi:hypothetical protein
MPFQGVTLAGWETSTGEAALLLRSKPLPGRVYFVDWTKSAASNLAQPGPKAFFDGEGRQSRKRPSALKGVRHKDFDNFDDFDGLKYLGKKFLGE